MDRALVALSFDWVCSSAGRAAISKVAGRRFESFRTRFDKVYVMDVSKKVSNRDAYASLSKAFRRLEDMKVEFKKIQWVEGKKTQEYAKVVVLATFISGVVLYLADVFVHKSLALINTILHMLFG